MEYHRSSLITRHADRESLTPARATARPVPGVHAREPPRAASGESSGRGRHERVLVLIVVGALLGTFLVPLGTAGVTSGGVPEVPDPANVVDCRGQAWNNSHLGVGISGCQALYGVDWQENRSASWNASTQFNFSFSLPFVAEISPQGQIVRLADPLDPTEVTTALTTSPGEVNLSGGEVVSVSAASGAWQPNDTWAGNGTQWSVENATLGTADVAVVFHLMDIVANATANESRDAAYRVKFDVAVAGWPWASENDTLGIALQCLGAGGAHFRYDPTMGSLVEAWDATGRPFASLVFGTNATVVPTPGSAPINATVGAQVGLFFAATPARQAVVLLCIDGVRGNYSAISYDPWVDFDPTAVVPVQNGPPPATETLEVPGWALVVGAVASVAALVAGITVRRARLRKGGEDLVRGIRQRIADGDELEEPPP